MSEATPIDDALAGLSELAACDLRLAKRFCARIESLPEDADDKAMDLARSYQRMARSYRQTLVVQARLRRELKAEARDDAAVARAERRARVDNLRAAIHAEIRPQIWVQEREEERCEELDQLLHDLLTDAAARENFLDLSRDAHVARILQNLDLDDAADAPPQGELSAQLTEGVETPDAIPEPTLFNGRLAPPMDPPSWETSDDTS